VRPEHFVDGLPHELGVAGPVSHSYRLRQKCHVFIVSYGNSTIFHGKNMGSHTSHWAIGPLGHWAIGCQASVPQKAKPAKAFPGQPAQPWRLPQEKLDHG